MWVRHRGSKFTFLDWAGSGLENCLHALRPGRGICSFWVCDHSRFQSLWVLLVASVAATLCTLLPNLFSGYHQGHKDPLHSESAQWANCEQGIWNTLSLRTEGSGLTCCRVEQFLFIHSPWLPQEISAPFETVWFCLFEHHIMGVTNSTYLKLQCPQWAFLPLFCIQFGVSTYQFFKPSSWDWV